MKPLIKIAGEQWIPWIRLKVEDEEKMTVEGPMGQFLELFTKVMNFEYELVRPEGGYWGNKYPNGSWFGMMGMVDREEVEFALGPFAVTQARWEAIDFSMAVHSDTQKIIMVRPGLENDVGGFLKPFTSHVWFLVLASMISIASAMMFIVWLEGRVFGEKTTKIFSRASVWTIQTLSQESSEWLPKRAAGRIVVTTWLLASLVFMSSYSGILTAMLTIPKVTIPIDSLSDLVNQNKLPWRLEAGAMIQPYLKNSRDDVHKRAYYQMSGTTPDCWSSRVAIARGEYAVICDQTSMKKIISWDFSSTGRCHTYVGREPVKSNIMMSIAFKRNSSYFKPANRLISTLRNTGIFAKWLGDEITNTTQCLKPPTSDRRDGIEALGLDAFYGQTLFLVGGWILGLLCLLGELGSATKWKMFNVTSSSGRGKTSA